MKQNQTTSTKTTKTTKNHPLDQNQTPRRETLSGKHWEKLLDETKTPKTLRDENGIIRMIQTPETIQTETKIQKIETPRETPTYTWTYPKDFNSDDFITKILNGRETFNPTDHNQMIELGMMISLGLIGMTDIRIKKGFKDYSWNKYFEFLIKPMKNKGLLPMETTKLILSKERILELKHQSGQ